MKGSILAFAATAAAFPQIMGSRAELEEMVKRSALAEAEAEAQLGVIGGVVDSLTSTITGLLGSVAKSVDPQNKRPEQGFDFKAPGSGDSRGPCPGLNLLANHGYLPRNGHVNFGQVVEATSRGFNMDVDLSSLLATFAVLTDGDIATESWWLGAGPGNVGGLNRHSTVEADISPNREDYYNGCGDNHHLSSRLFKQNTALALAATSKQYDLGVMGNHYALQSKFAQTYNPYLYYFPFPQIVSLGAYAFYPNFFSNGTYRAGGVANYESISSIIGAKYDATKNQFTYVPETWPKNWYRRATPYGAVTTLVDIFTSIFPKNIVTPGVAQLGTPNLSPQTILCDLYMGINSIVPLFVAGTEEQVAAATTWAISKLDPYFSNTVLGCPTSAISKNFLFPNASSKGGPLNPPPAVVANAGNNVYNKVYFTTAPTKPKC